jgi:hypothetical protein
MIEAYLHRPIHKAGVRYNGRYCVEFDGDLIVEDSRDPETDLARALLARGITGLVKVIDANTKMHRTTVDIENAAKLRTHGGQLRPIPEAEKRSPAAEEGLVVPTISGDDEEAA